MTRLRIATGLHLLITQLANGETERPEGWDPHEWAYVKGLASGAIIELETKILKDAP
jgi:hypothetical protein